MKCPFAWNISDSLAYQSLHFNLKPFFGALILNLARIEHCRNFRNESSYPQQQTIRASVSSTAATHQNWAQIEGEWRSRPITNSQPCPIMSHLRCKPLEHKRFDDRSKCNAPPAVQPSLDVFAVQKWLNELYACANRECAFKRIACCNPFTTISRRWPSTARTTILSNI